MQTGKGNVQSYLSISAIRYKQFIKKTTVKENKTSHKYKCLIQYLAIQNINDKNTFLLILNI